MTTSHKSVIQIVIDRSIETYATTFVEMFFVNSSDSQSFKNILFIKIHIMHGEYII